MTAVPGPITKPFHTALATAWGASRGVPNSPEASRARSSEAKAIDQPACPSDHARYKGLMPSGSRASSSRRCFGSQQAKANIPRSRLTASGPCRPSARSMTAVSPVDRNV